MPEGCTCRTTLLAVRSSTCPIPARALHDLGLPLWLPFFCPLIDQQYRPGGGACLRPPHRRHRHARRHRVRRPRAQHHPPELRPSPSPSSAERFAQRSAAAAATVGDTDAGADPSPEDEERWRESGQKEGGGACGGGGGGEAAAVNLAAAAAAAANAVEASKGAVRPCRTPSTAPASADRFPLSPADAETETETARERELPRPPPLSPPPPFRDLVLILDAPALPPAPWKLPNLPEEVL